MSDRNRTKTTVVQSHGVNSPRVRVKIIPKVYPAYISGKPRTKVLAKVTRGAMRKGCLNRVCDVLRKNRYDSLNWPNCVKVFL